MLSAYHHGRRQPGTAAADRGRGEDAAGEMQTGPAGVLSHDGPCRPGHRG